jgi:antitoxin Phd
MTTLTMRNHRGQSVEVESISATEAKNSFGRLLEHTIAGGMVAITRHREPRAVLLSIDEYQALTARVEDPIDRLRGEFDSLVARMQTPAAKAAGAALFSTPEHEPKAPGKSAKSPRR